MSARPPTGRGRGNPARPRPTLRLAQVLGVLVVVALVVAIGSAVVRGNRPQAGSPAVGEVVTPAHLGRDESLVVGGGPVEVVVYYDYLCPACGAFESANGDELDRLVEGRVVTVRLRPIAFLDRLSDGTRYSTRAANAVATVADLAPDAVWRLHRALFAHQPREGGPGLTDAELRDVATEAGVPASVSRRFAEGRFEAWVADRTRAAFGAGVQGTPTIMVAGERFTGNPYEKGQLAAAIEAAR